MAFSFLKHTVARAATKLGYRIEQDMIGDNSRVDVFDLIVRYMNVLRGGSFFFVQVGANDGITVDPINKYIVGYHWKGILVEPQPAVFEQLRITYRNEPQLIFENVAIAEQNGTMSLYCLDDSMDIPAGTGWASFNKNNVTRFVGRDAPVKEIQVPTIVVSALLAKHQVQSIDLLQIDTEGYDYVIMKMFLETGINPSIIRFEYPLLSRTELQECLAALASRGYQAHKQGVDIIAFKRPVLMGDGY
jgi:FkbM family methyltransferase